MFCCYKLFVKVPSNFACLAVYTITHAWLVGAVITQYYEDIVLSAFVCTMTMFFGLTVLAASMKEHIGKNYYCMAGLVTLCISVITLAILNMFI